MGSSFFVDQVVIARYNSSKTLPSSTQDVRPEKSLSHLSGIALLPCKARGGLTIPLLQKKLLFVQQPSYKLPLPWKRNRRPSALLHIDDFSALGGVLEKYRLRLGKHRDSFGITKPLHSTRGGKGFWVLGLLVVRPIALLSLASTKQFYFIHSFSSMILSGYARLLLWNLKVRSLRCASQVTS